MLSKKGMLCSLCYKAMLCYNIMSYYVIMLCVVITLRYVITLCYVVLSAWVTWPEHPKDAKDKVERPKGPLYLY